MKDLTENQKKRKLKKIDQIKKELRYEKQKFGGYHDGRGLRYSIAELYFEINDYKKTNRYLNWFFKTFPDDITYPHFKLGASYAQFQAKKISKCLENLIQINNENTYILNIITDIEIENQNKYEPYEFNSKFWAIENKEKLKLYTETKFTNWIGEIINSKNYQSWYIKYISILKLIKDLDVSNERTELLEASYKCINDWVAEFKASSNT